MSNPYDTSMSTLSPALASLMNMGDAGGLAGGLSNQQVFAPSYEAGGMIGPGGMPEPIGMPQAGGMPPGAGLAEQGQPQERMDPKMLDMHLNQFVSQQPQEMEQIRAAILEAVQSGEISFQELNTIVQLFVVASQNPEMYPHVRSYAIQQGIADEDDLPPQYDQGLIFVVLLAARAVQQELGAQGEAPAMGAGQPVPSMASGGMTPKSRKSDGSVLINAHEDEYVIPANVVRMKGKEFFDNLVEKYKA